jgi:hypothetical protein
VTRARKSNREPRESFEIQPPWRRRSTCDSTAPARKHTLKRASYAYASEMPWLRTGKHRLALMSWVPSSSQAGPQWAT